MYVISAKSFYVLQFHEQVVFGAFECFRKNGSLTFYFKEKFLA